MCVGGVDHLRSNTNASFIEKYDSRLDKWTSMSTSINNMFSSLNSSSSSLSSSMNSNSGSNMPSHNLIKRVQFGVALLNSDFLYIVIYTFYVHSNFLYICNFKFFWRLEVEMV